MKTASKAPQILVIDDDESMRYLLQTRLTQSNYMVTLAVNGSHAIQILQGKIKFDLVLCDLNMQLKNGIEVIRFMRENNMDTPTVIMSAAPAKDKIIAAAQLGVKDVLVKPIRQADLLKTVESKVTRAPSSEESVA